MPSMHFLVKNHPWKNCHEILLPLKQNSNCKPSSPSYKKQRAPSIVIIPEYTRVTYKKTSWFEEEKTDGEEQEEEHRTDKKEVSYP